MSAATATSPQVLVPGPIEEASPCQRVERLETLFATDIPEPGGLRDRQAEARHLLVLGSNQRVEIMLTVRQSCAVGHGVHFHTLDREQRSCRIASQEIRAFRDPSDD